MKLNWKWIGIGVGGFVGVLVLAVVLFIAFFPKELAAREAVARWRFQAYTPDGKQKIGKAVWMKCRILFRREEE